VHTRHPPSSTSVSWHFHFRFVLRKRTKASAGSTASSQVAAMRISPMGQVAQEGLPVAAAQQLVDHEGLEGRVLVDPVGESDRGAGPADDVLVAHGDLLRG
jgi:hypothetical protein